MNWKIEKFFKLKLKNKPDNEISRILYPSKREIYGILAKNENSDECQEADGCV